MWTHIAFPDDLDAVLRRMRFPHFAEALAHKAIDAGMRVAWFTFESLTAPIGCAAGTASRRASPHVARCIADSSDVTIRVVICKHA